MNTLKDIYVLFILTAFISILISVLVWLGVKFVGG